MLVEYLKSPKECGCDPTIIHLNCRFGQSKICEQERCRGNLVYGADRWESVLGRRAET